MATLINITDPFLVLQKGQPDGVASLDPSGKLPIAQLPAISTSIVTEGTNLYYTNTRVQTFSDTRYALRSTTILPTGSGILGGGDLSTNRTFSLDFSYLDDRYLAGYKQKAPVRVATTANITLSAPQTIDGVAVIAGDRVLVKNQTLGQENGIYIVAAGSWTRSTDFDTASPDEISQGAAIFVQEGTLLGKTGWSLSTPDPITVGTTPLTFIQYSGANAYTAGTGLQLIGNQFSALTTTALWNANQLQGVSVSNVAPSNGQLIQYNGTAWSPFTPNYLTGNQTITLSGDVTGSGSTTIATTISASSVRSKLSAGTGISYNSTSGVITNTAPDQTVTLTQGSGVTVTGTYPSFTISATGTGGTVTSVGFTSTDLTVSGSPITSTGTITANITNNAVTFAKIQDLAATRLLGRYSATLGDPQEIQIGTGLTLNSTTGVLSGNTGTVTSVGMTVPSIFAVGGSPITTSGVLSLTLTSQTALNVFAVGAANAVPSFQLLTAAHIPTLTASKISDFVDTVRTSVSAGTGISYNSATGVITNTAPSQTVSLTAGTGISISGSYPSFTITNTAPNVTPTWQQVMSAGNTFLGNAILGANGNTSAYNFTVIRNTASVNHTVTYGNSTGAVITSTDSTNTRLFLVPTGLTAPQYSPDGGTNLYTVWHSNNHQAGAANNAALTGANVYSNIITNASGHLTSVTSRALTSTDIGAAPATGSGNYIQNTASLQASSNFYISGIGRTDGSFQVRKDGSATYSATFYLANTANSRAVNFQLNEDANPGLSTWIHNGTTNIKRAEQFANDGRLSIYADNGEGINLVRAVSTVTNSTAGIRFNALNASSAPVSYAQIWGIIESNTAGSENGSLAFNTRMGGSVTEKMRLSFDGTLSKIGTLGNINLAASGAELAFTRSGANFIRATGAAGYLNIVTGGAGLTDAESAITIAASNAVTIRGAVVTSSTVSVGSLPASASGGSFVVANANVLNSRTPTQVAAELATLLPTTGTTNYIQNQNTGVQTGNFNISGNGTVGGTLLATTAGGSGSVVSRSTSTGDALFTADVSGVSSTVIRTFRTGGRTGIFNNANEAISIITNGNVGIGGANPAYKLHTVSSGASVIMAQNSTAPSATSGAFLHGFATGTPSAANHRLGGVSFGSNTTGSTYATGIQVEAWSEGAWTSGVSHPSYLRFMTTATGENTLSERMRLTAAGRLGINTDTPATTLHVGGIVTGAAFYSENGSDLPIWAQNGNTMTFAVGTSVPKMYLDDSGNLGVGITPLAARGSILQAEGNVWCTDAYILGSAAGSTPIGEFGLDGNVFIRTMGTQNINFRTNASTQRMSIVHSTGNVVLEGQIQIKGGVPGAGKILTSDSAGLATWQSPAAVSTPTLDQVLTAGNDAINSDIDLIGDNRSIGWWSGANRRFLFRKEAEPTANFGFYKYDDAGTPALTATITRATGVWNFVQVPTRAGNNIWDAANHVAGSAFTPTLTGANVLSTLTVNSAGHVTALTTRALTATDISAAPASGSGNYIQAQTASAQSASWRIGGIGKIERAGSNSYSEALSILNVGGTRGVSFQLNADSNSGWSTWIHNGTTFTKRLEILATGVATLTGSLTALGSLTSSQDPGVGAGRTSISFTTGGGFIQGEGHNGTTWVSGGLTYDGTSHTLTGGDVIINNDLQVDGTITATGGGFNSARALKEDIRVFTKSALEIVSKIPIKEFKYKNGNNNTIGFIADEVPAEVLVDNKEAMDIYSTMGILLKAIQELNEKVDGLVEFSK